MDVKSSRWRVSMDTAVGCLLLPHPSTERGVEVRTQPSPAAVPPTQNSRGPRRLCGNKLTGRVNIKVWKEPLLFLRWSHQSHSPAWFKYSFKSGTQPVKFKHQPAQRRSYDVRGDVLMWERSAALLPVCGGDVWCTVTSRGGDSGEDLGLLTLDFIGARQSQSVLTQSFKPF